MTRRTIDAMIDFLSPLGVIPGMGEKRIRAMAESGIETIGDLLYWFPSRYIDRSVVTPLSEAADFIDQIITVSGIIDIVRIEKGSRGRLRANLIDETGSIELLWFQGVQFFSKSIHKGDKLLVTGKVSKYNHCQMVHPMTEAIKSKGAEIRSILPHYPVTIYMKEASIQQKLLITSTKWVLDHLTHYPQVLPSRLEIKLNFHSLQECLAGLHFPRSLENIDRHKERLKYEELYKLALTLCLSRKKFKLPGRQMTPGLLPDTMRKMLPFKLTGEQEKAIDILYKDALAPQRMHRLLQGDVGSGKTLVAFFASLAALNSGLQVAWLAPTDVLARQTFDLVESWLVPLGFSASLLKGGIAPHIKQTILTGIADGSVKFVVGTHALFQPSVKFSSIGMIIIDEQHKFGAQQRLSMQEKDIASDFLLMSATPIPQTLARTLYGDLDIVTIDKSPQGRIPVSTFIVPEYKRGNMEQFILDHMSIGEQAFYVVPRIEQDDSDTDSPVKGIEATLKTLTSGAFSSTAIGSLHGQLDNTQKEEVMQKFVNGSTSLLLATTVVEVGVNIPDATIMVIENAERFGLAQLHQLRGRVGRNSQKSFCFLLTSENVDPETLKKLSEFCKTHDGFKIAEMDLSNRGPGEINGFRQSGWYNLQFADILKDAALFKEIKKEIDCIIGS